MDYMNNIEKLKNEEITIIQYPKGKLSYSNGIITEIDNYELTHLASTEEGSSGSPIFIKGSIKVIGIHKGGKKDKNENYGDFIGPIYNFFINLLKYKIELENGEYYIGEFKNDLRNGKGILYYSNGNIQYEGDWINDNAEGNGKYIWENGQYYIGQYKNGLKHGKGTIFYSNGNIKYEGDWINDKPEGN